MDQSVIEYLQQQRSNVEELLNVAHAFHRTSTQKLKTLEKALTPQLVGRATFAGMSSGYPALFDLLSYCAVVSDAVTLQMNINLSPDGWCFNLHNYKGDQIADRVSLEEWLTNRGIIWFVRQQNPWRLGCSRDEPLPYASEPQLVQEHAVKLLLRIS